MGIRHSAISADRILDSAYGEICQLAEEVGIDGERLLANLPAPGVLCTGNRVPVISPRYRGTCNVLYFENTRDDGMVWPFLRLFTFRHGGVVRTFNGWHWLRDGHQASLAPTHVIRVSSARNIDAEEDQQRYNRYQKLMADFHRAAPVRYDHPWLQHRLCGHASPALTTRLNIRTSGHCLLAPIEHPLHGVVGFHRITTYSHRDTKRHFTKASGAMRGGFVRIAPVDPHQPVMVCEGLATGLSLALVWPGEIRVALTAYNLKPVMESAPVASIIACDNDQWKPDAGNTGVLKAREALRPRDQLRCPNFSSQYSQQKPTDFNDLLQLEGLMALRDALHPPLVY